MKIRFCNATYKILIAQLDKAYTLGDLRLVKRISVLLGVDRGETTSQITETNRVSHQSIYNRFLKLFF